MSNNPMLPGATDEKQPLRIRRIRLILPPLAALALTALVLLPVPGLRQGYDWVGMHIFYKTHYRETLLAGSLPLWNPHTALGRPFLADVETTTLYAPNLLYLAGINAGLCANLFLHFLLLLLGMLALARNLGCRELVAWFAALGFALGAPLLGRLQGGQIQVFCTLCWLPAVLATALSLREEPGARSAVRLAGALALMFLAGSPPMFWLGIWSTITVLAVAWFTPRSVGRHWAALGWLIVTGGLAAGLVAVQALPFLELVAQGNRNALPPEYALTHGMAGPSWGSLLRSRPDGAFFRWEYNLYAGLPLVLASLMAIRNWWAASLRVPLVLSFVFTLLSLGEATPVLPWLVEHMPGWDGFRYPSRYAIVLVFALCLTGAHGLEQCARWLEKHNSGRAARWFCAAMVTINAAECTRAYFERAGIYAGPAIALEEAELAARLRSAGLLRSGQPPPRIVAPPWIVRENSGLLHGYATLSGFGNPFLENVWSEIHRRLRLTPVSTDPVNLPLVAYAVPQFVYDGLDIAIRWDPDAKSFDWPPSPPARVWLDAPGHAEIEDYRSTRITLRSSAQSQHHLLLAEPWYPGWTIMNDGRPRPVEAAGWMRMITLPAGSHRVEMHYTSTWLACGAAISLLTLLVAAGLWFGGKPVPMSSSR